MFNIMLIATWLGAFIGSMVMSALTMRWNKQTVEWGQITAVSLLVAFVNTCLLWVFGAV